MTNVDKLKWHLKYIKLYKSVETEANEVQIK